MDEGKTFIATDNQTSLAATSKDDTIYTGAANQGVRVNAGAGDDKVFAASSTTNPAKNDQVEAGDGDDLVSGGDGNDTLGGGAGDDILLGGAGDDVLGGGTGNDILSGGSGADVFQFTAGFGKDIITDFQFGADRLDVFAGAVGNTRNARLSTVADIQAFSSANSGSITRNSNNSVTISFGSDSITLLGAGDDFFGPYNGSMNSGGTSGDDVVLGTDTRSGSGTIKAQDIGGAGNDVVAAGSLGDNVQGNAGNDILIGGAGNDLIGGQDGDDILFGNAGNDTLGGGQGNDILEGDDGADMFTFSGATFGNDTVTDLNFSEGDSLSLMTGSGPATRISDLAQLNSYVAAHGVTLSNSATNDAVTLTFNNASSIQLIGYGSSGGVISVS